MKTLIPVLKSHCVNVGTIHKCVFYGHECLGMISLASGISDAEHELWIKPKLALTPPSTVFLLGFFFFFVLLICCDFFFVVAPLCSGATSGIK